jgi:dienelactone hydrolase
MRPVRLLGKVFKYSLVGLLIIVVAGLAWLRWDARQSRDAWFAERHGALDEVHVTRSSRPSGQLSEEIELVSTSGLRVSARSIRDGAAAAPQPVLLLLVGIRTGQDSVDLFGRVRDYAVVGVEYPYAGRERVSGAAQKLGILLPARRAILDTVPAVQLVIDWLAQQDWVDADAIILAGGSLGLPFATAIAARETRVAGVILAHGAAQLQPWLEAQVAREIDAQPAHYPLSMLLYWMVYGPIFDPATHVAGIAPRPLLVIGASEDERTPPGQVELLYTLAGEPKRMRYTQGMHAQPNRTEILAALLRIVEEEFGFLTGRQDDE